MRSKLGTVVAHSLRLAALLCVLLAVPGIAWGQSTVKLTTTNKVVTSTAPSGGTASATFRLASAGKIRFQTSVGGTYDEQAPFDEWLEPESAIEASNYEVKAVQLSDPPSSGVVNAWMSLGGTSRDWTMSRSAPGTSETEITILIRRIGTATTLASAKVTLRATVGNNPPAVSLTAPVSGSSFDTPVNTTLAATASDADGISKVEFFDNGVRVGMADTTAPYSVAWTPTTIGNHSLTARATDSFGAVTTSAPSTVTVSTVKLTATNKIVDSTVALGGTASATFRLATAGKIRFQTSVNGLYAEQSPFDEWLEPESITGGASYEARAIPVSGTVSAGLVNQWLGLGSATPRDWKLTNAIAGTAQAVFTLQIRRIGTATVLASTNVTLRAAVTAPPNTPPAVSLTAPSAGATFTVPADITLTATASDSDGAVSTVEFFRDNSTTLIGAGVKNGNTFTYNWTSVPAGPYSLTAKATDNFGASTITPAISVTVVATVPQPVEVHYEYDALGRLIHVLYGNGSEVIYAYDAAGNRTIQSQTLK